MKSHRPAAGVALPQRLVSRKCPCSIISLFRPSLRFFIIMKIDTPCRSPFIQTGYKRKPGGQQSAAKSSAGGLMAFPHDAQKRGYHHPRHWWYRRSPAWKYGTWSPLCALSHILWGPASAAADHPCLCFWRQVKIFKMVSSTVLYRLELIGSWLSEMRISAFRLLLL